MAQLVERNLAKVEVAGSSLVFRSNSIRLRRMEFFVCRWISNFKIGNSKISLAPVVELVDTQDLKSCPPKRG